MKKFFIILFFCFSCCSINSYVIDTNVVTGLTRPVAFTFLPNTNLIITLKDGPVKIYTLNNTLVSTFWDFTDSVETFVEQGVIGVCLDPNYTANRYIYIYYIHKNPHQIRAIRFTENNNSGTSPFIILSIPFGAYTNHVGGNMHFGADNKLYIGIGELYDSTNAQLKTNPFGKILRINSNGVIPPDNPFYDDGNPNTGYDDRIWCLGLRNPYDFCFSPVNDSLYLEDNGFRRMDEADFIRKGKNYGWPICEGTFCYSQNDSIVAPMRTFVPTAGTTGVMIYNGNVFNGLNNHLLIATYNYGIIYNCTLGNPPFYDTVTASENLITTFTGLTTILQGPDGYIYGMIGGYIANGKIFRIKPDPFGIKTISTDVPEDFLLFQNYPNPFNPVTYIRFSLKRNSSNVLINLYDLKGSFINSFVRRNLSIGTYEISWDASNYPSGVYFYELQAGEYKDRKKMVLVK